MVLISPADQVAWWAHIGGMVAGAILILFMRRPGVPLFDRGLRPSDPLTLGAAVARPLGNIGHRPAAMLLSKVPRRLPN